MSLHQVGDRVSQTGDDEGADRWFERAVAEKEQGDVHGRVDHASLGGAYTGRLLRVAEGTMKARPWFERAVTEAEQGDVHGRVDHASLGRACTGRVLRVADGGP